MSSRGFAFPKFPPKIKTPEPREVKGALFDAEKVDKGINAFRNIRHTQGKLAGQPLEPDPWQIAYVIAPVFGWVEKIGQAKRCVLLETFI